MITWWFFFVFFFFFQICHSVIVIHIRYYASLNFLWAINSYCMVLYQSLMYNTCISFLVCHCCPVNSVSSEIMSYSLFMFNCHGTLFFRINRYRTNKTVKTLWPVTSCGLDSDSHSHKPLGKCIGLLLVAHHDVDMGLAHDLCSIYGMSVRIWKQCCIHVTISFQMLSPMQNFPLKFLYFDIIKKSKESLFLCVVLSFASLWSRRWRCSSNAGHRV